MDKVLNAYNFIRDKVDQKDLELWTFGKTYSITKDGKLSMAEYASLQSDISVVKFPASTERSNRKLCLNLIACGFLYINSIQYQDIREHYYKIGSKRNWLGHELECLAEMLSIKDNAPFRLLQIYFDFYSTQDFYGNDWKYIMKSLELVKYIIPYLPSQHPVKYPQRKRGYNDKGTLPRDPRPRDCAVPGKPRSQESYELAKRKEIIEAKINIYEGTDHAVFFETIDPEINNQQETLVSEATSHLAEESPGSLYSEPVDLVPDPHSYTYDRSDYVDFDQYLEDTNQNYENHPIKGIRWGADRN